MSAAVVPSAEPQRVVIVGAGHGGAAVAATLRQQGFEGEVVLIGAEPAGPYHRPPLSKSLLGGELHQPLQPKDFYRDQRVELRTATRVVSIDRGAQLVRLGNGETVSYDVLIVATGAKARRLTIPGVELEKVYELRTIAHARILHDVLTPGRHLAIVGGGWIGLEVAASARSAGVEVTVIEREERLLARVASRELSSYLTECHVRNGVRILTSTQVIALEPAARGMVGAVNLEDGGRIPCDRVLISVGAVADDELMSSAGLPCEGGAVVDYRACTADPRIYAVGDMTRRPVGFDQGMFRLESIPSTLEQARQAVASILGKPAPPPEVPWFWSDQYDLKLQIAGLLIDTDTVTVRADAAANKSAMFHTKGGRLVAVEAINAGAEFMAGKRLIRDQVELDLARLGDSSVPLDEVAMMPAVAATAPRQAPQEAVESGGDQPPGPGGKVGEPRVSFIQATGEIDSIEIPVGLSLMDGAVRNNLAGIAAECGGMCSCGTCHVYVDPMWEQLLPEAEYEEADLIEFLDGREPSSRLSCQIVMGDELDGLVVRVPELS